MTSGATRVQLKGEQCQVFKAASYDEVKMAEAEITLIDSTIQIGHYQQQHLVRSQQLKKFIDMISCYTSDIAYINIKLFKSFLL